MISLIGFSGKIFKSSCVSLQISWFHDTPDVVPENFPVTFAPPKNFLSLKVILIHKYICE
ncbi:hypothetical protein Hanom_Chr10g00918771 [Helianthus anomalus]